MCSVTRRWTRPTWRSSTRSRALWPTTGWFLQVPYSSPGSLPFSRFYFSPGSLRLSMCWIVSPGSGLLCYFNKFSSLFSRTLIGLFLTHALSSGGRSKHRNYLSVNPSLKYCRKKEGQYNLKRQKRAVLGYDVSNTQLQDFYVIPSPQLYSPHPPPNLQSLVWLLSTPRKPIFGGLRIWIDYSSYPIF